MKVFILTGFYMKRGEEILGVYSDFSEAMKDKKSLLSHKNYAYKKSLRDILCGDENLLNFEFLYINEHDVMIKAIYSDHVDARKAYVQDEIEHSERLMSELQDELDNLEENPVRKSALEEELEEEIEHLKGLISELQDELDNLD
jgi:DNA repair exonuclease SbcCD ATPase subunit